MEKSKLMHLLLGPELLWLLIYGAAVFIAKANEPASKPMDSFIDKIWFFIPLMAVLTFALWWMPAVEKNWLLLRVWVACLVGGHFAMEKAMNAYSSQGPGVGMGYLAGMLFLFVVLVAGSVVVTVVPAVKKMF